MRRVALGGVIGGLPGLLMALVPVLLHEMGVISSDASQVGFVGAPLLLGGVFVGMLIAVSGTGYAGRVMLGAGAGLVVGLVVGTGIAAATTLPGTWLFTTPAAMIAGGVVGAWWGEHGHGGYPTAPQL